MAFFNNKPKTSTQKAQKAQMGVFVRLVGCAYLIYVVVQLLSTAPEDDTLSPTLKIVISVFFLIAAAAVIFITVLEFIRSWKSGAYKSESYADDIISAYATDDSEPAAIDESSIDTSIPEESDELDDEQDEDSEDDEEHTPEDEI